ncbi:MAG: GGDEF domain-containing protein [Victivallales bacterium]|jgi:diguanylate cyclase (GGDEF)-like protein
MGDNVTQSMMTQTMPKIDLMETRSAKGRPYLTVSIGRDMGMMVLLQGSMSIGRSPESSIVLDDELVSWDHFRVINFNGHISLQDNNSRNGVFVDGEKVEHCELNVGSNIQIGDTVMKLELLSDLEVEFRQSLYNRANVDLLTGAYNRHYFQENARQELSLSKRERTPLKIVMMDLDYFKNVNDKYGHLAGDYVLSKVANIIRNSIRDYDLLCRYGGEEFVLLLRGAISLGDTEELCERIRRQIEDRGFEYGGISIRLTISAGVCFQEDTQDLTLEDIIFKADKALYESKKCGRNRITMVK